MNTILLTLAACLAGFLVVAVVLFFLMIAIWGVVMLVGGTFQAGTWVLERITKLLPEPPNPKDS